MYLKALEIQGFKSFPDRTRISFDEGITAVVGPNGSGKSNISDAIRWVLGETSVKQLRGGGKMENVIFGGTENRGAMGYASVQLVVDNSDRRIDVEADEVTIGRKYYRSGDSEYSVNGQSVRLRDVYEMLLDTGLGRDGYSIIGQGRVAEIVSAKSAERREIFEEASGIARYRYRKNEAERRLAASEENLVRLRDILAELEGRVGPLERESEKAKKFLQLSAERKSLEVTLWVDTIKTTREDLRSQQRKIEIATADYDQKGAEIDQIDQETQETRAEIEQIIIEIERANAKIRTLQEQAGGRDAKVAVLRNNIEHNESSMQTLLQEMEQSGDAAGEIETEIENHREEIEKEEERLAETNRKIASLEAELAEIGERSLATGERRGQLQAQLAELTAKTTEWKVGQAGAETTVESAKQQLEEREKTLVEASASLDRLVAERGDTEAYLSAIEAEQTKLENIKGGLEMKLASRQKNLAEAEQAEQKALREAENAEHRLHMLRELEHSLDGFQTSVKNVVKASREGKLRGIIGPVSTILDVKPGYEVAIETALGFSLQNVVVDGEAAAKAAMAHLKQTNGGRATFLPMDTVKPQHFKGKLPDGAAVAQSLVRYDAKYENIASSLLARIVVVEDIADASRAAKALDYRNRVVTRDGQVINAGGSFTGGSISRSAGLFSRQQEMLELQKKQAELQAKQQQAAQATAKAKAEADALQAELTATSSEMVTHSEDRIRADGELSRILAAQQAGEEQRRRLTCECDELTEQIEQAVRRQKEAAEEQQRLSKQIEELSEELAGIAGEDDGFLAEREKLSQALSSLRLEALGQERDAELHRQNIETLKSRTGEAAARKEALSENIKRLQAENAEYEEKIKNVGREAEENKGSIEQTEQEIRALTEKRLAKEGSITGQTGKERQITSEREALGREIARLGEQRTSMESRYDSTISQLWDEYELALSDAEKMCVAFTSASELRRRVGELRGKIRDLGHVNVGAIEEFEEVNSRYTFLKKQVQDVEDSKAELEKMIAELCAEMTALFAESFADINDHFGRIFAELFGGGRGALKLADPEDLLESGIDIEVAPPGKIIKDLSALSGGEQALVAICIYFAILAVNPSPFCVLDEIEAALDDVNVIRFAQYLRRITKHTQFIVITHRRGTMEEADVLYGVTMQEDGISKLLRLNVAEVDASLVR